MSISQPSEGFYFVMKQPTYRYRKELLKNVSFLSGYRQDNTNSVGYAFSKNVKIISQIHGETRGAIQYSSLEFNTYKKTPPLEGGNFLYQYLN
jgi:hypothetical protein